MTDGYFELASLGHFWVRRRFEVFQKLAGELVSSARDMAEIGCGQGLLQRQIELAYGREVTGFDLNENGLKHSLSQRSRVICYDVFQKAEAFRERFDLIFLWDVLEHLEDEDSFLEAVRFHLVVRRETSVQRAGGRMGVFGIRHGGGALPAVFGAQSLCGNRAKWAGSDEVDLLGIAADTDAVVPEDLVEAGAGDSSELFHRVWKRQRRDQWGLAVGVEIRGDTAGARGDIADGGGAGHGAEDMRMAVGESPIRARDVVDPKRAPARTSHTYS